jgi:hypothetical protein
MDASPAFACSFAVKLLKLERFGSVPDICGLAASGGKSPHPDTQQASDNKRDHAYPHRYLVSADRYLRLFDQAHHVAKGKKRENYTRDTQSRSL